MDHLPVPSNPYHASLSVPYLAHSYSELVYDGQGFLGFPTRLEYDLE